MASYLDEKSLTDWVKQLKMNWFWVKSHHTLFLPNILMTFFEFIIFLFVMWYTVHSMLYFREKSITKQWQTYICSVITCLLQRIQNWLLGICQWKLCFILKMRNDWLGAVLYKMNLSTCIEFRVMKIFLIVNFYYSFR